jgi:CubicO group peptidase (beta-lactamase class C family)
MIAFALLFLSATALSPRPAAQAAAPDAAELGRALDAWVQPLVDSGLLAGNLLVARRDTILLERSWGFADAEAKVPNHPDLPSCIASVTKPMTVILALQLIEERKLGYTDPLSKWIPDFPQGDSITIEHLLRHRSGIPHRVTTEEEETRPHTAADMVALAKKATLTQKPGAGSAYSSGGFAVLARVLELASGRSYGDLARERLFEPLGMSHTFHPDASAPAGPIAASYAPILGGARREPMKDLSFLVGAGSVFSTARDLHRLLWADMSGRFGEGARQSALRGAKVNWNGSTNGYRAFVEYDTLSGNAVIFTGNLHSGAADQLRGAVAALLEGKFPAAPLLPPGKAAAVAPRLLASYEGLYDVAGNPRLSVRATESGLDVNQWTLVATGDSTFFSLRDFATVKVVAGAAGGVERFDWLLGGQTWPCPRVGDLPKD